MQFGRTTLSKFVIEQTRAQHGELGVDAGQDGADLKPPGGVDQGVEDGDGAH